MYMERESRQKHKVLSLSLHTSWIWTKAREWRRSRNAINDLRAWHWFETNGWAKGKSLFIKWLHHHAPHTHFCTQIERRLPANCSVIFVISSSIVNFRIFLESPRAHCSRLRPCTFKSIFDSLGREINKSDIEDSKCRERNRSKYKWETSGMSYQLLQIHDP
jgi:hypothetical protein